MKNAHALRRVAALCLFTASSAFAQSFYLVSKSQSFVQTSAAGAVSDPNNAFSFSAQMATNGSFTLPSGAPASLTFVSGDDAYELNQSFASKADLDAAFPNGVYRLTATGQPTLSFTVSPDSYSTATPQVTNGTWSSGGLLVVDPAQSTTINFSAFADYATGGSLGHYDFKIQSFSGNDPKLRATGATQAVLGIPLATTALTSFTIPAQSLTAGAVYVGSLNYDRAVTLDTTTVSGGGVVSLFSKQLLFYIVAKASATVLPPAPVITLQPIDRTGVTGGSVVLSFSTAANTANPTILWWKNGQTFNMSDATKYNLAFTANGSSLTINQLAASDAGNYYAQVITPGGMVTTATIKLTVLTAAPPTVSVQSTGTAVSSGGSATFTATVNGTSPTYQWRFDGNNLAGATNATYQVSNAGPADAGVYTLAGTTATGTSIDTVILGISSASKVIGNGSEVGTDITAPNKNVYDQILLSGPAATVTADAGQVTRTSFIDLTNDIVQVEFSGAGTLSLLLANSTGPATPINYNQPTVSYMKGHVGIVITGANETTNVSVFSVGRLNAFDPTGAFNITLPVSATNDPAKNGSVLFQGHADTVYDGLADISFIAIASTNGKFGGIRASNASFYATRGLTGIYAPGVQFTGPVFVGDINASDNATPVLILGAASDTRITGGDLFQSNGQTVKVRGINQLKFTDGATSHNTLLPAQKNQAHLDQAGLDVTVNIVVNPP